MNSRMNRILLAILGLGALLTPHWALAQTISSPYRFLEARQEAGPFLGTMSPGTGRFGFGPAPGIAFGGRYGINLAGPFGLEGVVTYLPTERAMIDPGRNEGDMDVGDMASDVVMIDGRLRFSLTGDRAWHNLAPFVLAGGGIAFDVSGDNLDVETLLPGDRFLVRADGTLFIWQLKTPIGFSDPERGFVGVDEKEWVSGPSFSLGLGIRF